MHLRIDTHKDVDASKYNSWTFFKFITDRTHFCKRDLHDKARHTGVATEDYILYIKCGMTQYHTPLTIIDNLQCPDTNFVESIILIDLSIFYSKCCQSKSFISFYQSSAFSLKPLLSNANGFFEVYIRIIIVNLKLRQVKDYTVYT